MCAPKLYTYKHSVNTPTIHQIEDKLTSIAIFHRQYCFFNTNIINHLYHHHHQKQKKKRASIPSKPSKNNENSRHFSTDGNYSGVGNSSLVEGGRIPPYSKASFACANHIDLLPTWLIGNVCARALKQRAYVHAHASAGVRARACNRLSRIYTHTHNA